MAAMLWVDKHRPRDLSSVDLHNDTTTTLKRLVESRDFPHLLFSGPNGAGKKTRVMAFLHAHYGESVLHLKLDHKSVQVNDHKSLDIATLSSPHHIDINPSDAGPTYDRVVVMQTIREIAETAPLVGGASATATPFKVVVLNEVDKLSRGAQQALRRTMEKYVSTCRLILICNSTSRLIAPLRSRCLGVRVPAPTENEIAGVIKKVAGKEGMVDVSDAFCSAVAGLADGNLRRALLLAESAKAAKIPFSGNGAGIPVSDWQLCIQEIAQDIVSEQTPKKLFDCRTKYYELLAHCIPADTVLRELTMQLLKVVQPRLRASVLQAAATFDHSLKQGSKPIVHLEAFTANVMKALKADHFSAP